MRRASGSRRAIRWLVAYTAAVAVLLLEAPRSPAADGIDLEVMIDGRPVAEATERDPISLYPDRAASIDMRVRNSTSAPIEIRTLRVEGTVMALTFFAYDTAVGIPVAPGTTESRRFSLDLVGIDGQATGLIRGAVAVLDPNRDSLASQELVFDVRGSLWSVYGVFGLTLAALTVLGLLTALVAMARHQLPENRWRRGVRFLTPGVGLGLLVVFTLSAVRVFVPEPERWVPILLISSGIFFALGYLTPTPDYQEEYVGEERLRGTDAAYETSGRERRPAGDDARP